MLHLISGSLTLSDGSLTLPLPGAAVFAANSRNSFLKSHAAGRIHGCSVRLPYIPGSALTNSPSDTHFALPVHLPSYHRLDPFLEKLTVRFSSFGLLSHFCRSDDRRRLIKHLPSSGSKPSALIVRVSLDVLWYEYLPWT